MSGHLYIRLGQDAIPWIAIGEAVHERGIGLAEASAHLATKRAIVLVPGEQVLLTRADLPTQNRQRLRQAVPYAIEEQLSEDVEGLHFALSRGRTESGVGVAVVARARMQSWLEQLSEAGVHPTTVVPEVLALPLASGEWSLCVEANSVLLRTGPTRGHSFDPRNAADLLSLALSTADPRPEHVRLFDCGGPLAEELQRICEDAGVAVTTETCRDDALALFARALEATAAPIDLLQGDFSRREQLGRMWRPWIPAVAMLAMVLLMQGVVRVYDYVSLSREEDRLAQRVIEVYRSAFPEARNIADPKRQMEGNLATLRGGGGAGGVVPLLVRSAPVFDATVGLELNALRYKDGMLEVDLLLGDLQALDQLKQSLSGKGLGVEIQTANSRADKVEGRLQIREAR